MPLPKAALAAAALLTALVPAVLPAAAASASTSDGPPEGAGPGSHLPWSAQNEDHVVRPRGQAGSARPSRVPMTYHGGPIMTTANIQPIFWGTSWPTAAGDKISGIDTFYSDWNGSRYAGTTTEYTNSRGVHVGGTSSSKPSVTDATPAANGSTTSAILAEVAAQISAGTVTLDTTGNGYYPVYTDVPRGTAGFCAWHSTGTIGGVRVQFAFFFRLDGDTGCDPADPSTVHSQGLEAIANVSAHELAEALTDPALNAWFDGAGAENGDKCAWTFPTATVTLSGRSTWRLQAEWSNAAFAAGTGFPNGSGQRGCLSGA